MRMRTWWAALSLAVACGGDLDDVFQDGDGIALDSSGGTGGTTATAGEDGEAGSGGMTQSGGEGEGSGGGSGGQSGTASEGSGDGDGDGDTTTSTTTSTSGDGDGDGDGDSTTMDCPSAAVDFEPVIPTVVLLIDQSGSMTQAFSGTTRWLAVRESLTDPTDGVLVGLEDDVRFGLSLYTSHNGDSGGACPLLTEVAPALSNFSSIKTQFDASSPDDETPTGESVAAVAAALEADPSPGPKIIVLATDGEPDTCAEPNPQNGQSQSVAAVEAAYAAGIETYVISVGSDVSAGHLQDLANAGAGVGPSDPDANYYVPSDRDEMVATFESIINGARPCTFTLDQAIVSGQEDQGMVTVNATPLVYEDANGWRVNSATEIELLGTSCTQIQEGEVAVAIEFPCGALVPQ